MEDKPNTKQDVRIDNGELETSMIPEDFTVPSVTGCPFN